MVRAKAHAAEHLPAQVAPRAARNAELVLTLPTLRVHALLGERRRVLLDAVQQNSVRVPQSCDGAYQSKSNRKSNMALGYLVIENSDGLSTSLRSAGLPALPTLRVRALLCERRRVLLDAVQQDSVWVPQSCDGAYQSKSNQKSKLIWSSVTSSSKA